MYFIIIKWYYFKEFKILMVNSENEFYKVVAFKTYLDIDIYT